MTIAASRTKLVTRPVSQRLAGNRSEAHTVKRGSASVPLASRPVPATPTDRPVTSVTVVGRVDNTL